MSRYIVTTLLAVAAAILTVSELAPTLVQPDGAQLPLMLRP